MLCCNVKLLVIVVLFLSFSVSLSETHNDVWLLQQYESGNLDSLRRVVSDIPEDSGFGQFLRGLFEPDGDEARFYYDRVILFHSGSPVEAYAMERLWQYHYAKGDMEQAERYYGFLQQRHPEFVSQSTPPDFAHGSGLSELMKVSVPVEQNSLERETVIVASAPPAEETVSPQLESGWTVQVGAYGFRSGAQKQSGQMRQFGSVEIRSKVSNGRMLSLVHVGMFKNRAEAEQLRERINAATGVQGRVVAVNK